MYPKDHIVKSPSPLPAAALVFTFTLGPERGGHEILHIDQPAGNTIGVTL